MCTEFLANLTRLFRSKAHFAFALFVLYGFAAASCNDAQFFGPRSSKKPSLPPPADNQDSDLDGVLDPEEGERDTDDDGTPNYLDPDDDGDGTASGDEDANQNGDPADDDQDKDTVPDYLEPNNQDTDNDGKPNYIDPDDDNDTVPTKDEDPDNDGDPTNDDTDNDGTPNYLDPDDDNDGIPTKDEDPNNDGDPTNDDSDNDGIPDYLDPDSPNNPGQGDCKDPKQGDDPNQGGKCDDPGQDDPGKGDNPFIRCPTGANKDQFPIYAKAYNIGSYISTARDDYVKHLGDPDAPYEGQDLEFMAMNFKPGAIIKDSLLFTEFCMMRYDVSPRKFDQGFPKRDGTSGTIDILEWFALDTFVDIMVPNVGAGNEWEFELESDDGTLMYLGENTSPFIDNDGLHHPYKQKARINLSPGKHRLRIKYFQGPKMHIALVLRWRNVSENGAFEIVPRHQDTVNSSRPRGFIFYQGPYNQSY